MSALYWLRNDLRFHDNAALNAFSQKPVGVAVWCPSASFLRAGPRRRDFILGSLYEFKNKLEARGGRVWLAPRPAPEALLPLLGRGLFTELIYSAECTTEEVAEEATFSNLEGVSVQSFRQSSLIAREDLPFALDHLPKHFTVFRERAEKRLQIAPPSLPATRMPKPCLPHLEFASSPATLGSFHPHVPPGEDAGLARIQDYIWHQDRLQTYKQTRDGLMNWDDSSKVSAWLAVGALSPRYVYQEIKRYERDRIKNESTYWLFFELLWRDFFRFNAERLGTQLFTRVGEVDRDPERLAAWCAGKTGQSFVDAHMRELNETGWMSGRGRQNVASFLAKTWRLDWRGGAAYFEQQLLDYDASSNWGNWAYMAGVGQDPRNRTLDVEWQATRYDSDGAYRRRWEAK